MQKEQARFSGALRYYHRSTPKAQQAGNASSDGIFRSLLSRVGWFKLSCIVLAILALGGIIAGLVIELR